MAAVAILACGWAVFNGGAAIGSLSYAYCPCFPAATQYTAMGTTQQEPNSEGTTKLWIVIGGLSLVNGLLAYWHNHGRAATAHYGDLSTFPFVNYVLGLFLLGYGLSYALSRWFFLRFNHSILPEVGNGLRTSSSRCSLYAFLLCLVPLPFSGPLALFYIPLIAL